MSAMHRTVGGSLMVLLAAMIGGSEVLAGEMTPLERVISTPKGELKNLAEEGHRRYMAAGCNGCHGGGGGGGMAPPLTNPVWIYGDDDDTLFRLIALGTGKLSPGDAFGKLGYKRKGSEGVVGPMPPFGEIISTAGTTVAHLRQGRSSDFSNPSSTPVRTLLRKSISCRLSQ